MKLCIFFSKSHIHLIFHQKWRIERGWDMKLVWSVIYTNTSTNVDTNTDFVKISHPSYFPSKIAHWEGLDHEIFLDLLLKLLDFFLKFWNLSWSFIFFHIHLIFHQKSRIERGWTNHDSGEKWNFVFLFFLLQNLTSILFSIKNRALRGVGAWDWSGKWVGEGSRSMALDFNLKMFPTNTETNIETNI